MSAELRSEPRTVDFYTRPGCGFSAALRHRLVDAGVQLNEFDIWDDPDAAARVRAVANGNETVPTVFIGSLGMVNPRLQQVLDALDPE